MTVSKSRLTVGSTEATSLSNDWSSSSSIDEAMSGSDAWKLPSQYQR